MTNADVPRIRRLDEAVVNRIAAGEIIHRPANALKELLENSLDAGATTIQITAQDGGLKVLQIQDNGHGINKLDLPVVAERFTTSKLKVFSDLESISTFGFRGEALASISHVAQLTITSKTSDGPCAYRACYSDGKLVPAKGASNSDPKACAGNIGTQITVENLFFNVPTRLKALKNASDEYSRILDVVMRYSIHNAGVSMSCKKQGATTPDVHTVVGGSVQDAIRQVYGAAVSKELLEVEATDAKYRCSIKGYISNPNYNVKKLTLLLFINGRLVESSMIKRMVDSVYSPYMPKGTHPWVYLSLELEPETLDVNVHPTKREVHFLNEEEIVESVSGTLQIVVKDANCSRTFTIQSLNTAPTHEISAEPEQTFKLCDTKFKSSPAMTYNSKQSNVAANRLVRTDQKQQSMKAFVVERPAHSSINESLSSQSQSKETVDICDVSEPDDDDDNVDVEIRKRTLVRLTSVLDMRRDCKASENTNASGAMRVHTFVGVVDVKLALIQHQTSLMLVNYHRLSRELFYQLILRDFQDMSQILFSEPLPLKDLLEIANTDEDTIAKCMQLYSSQAQLLSDYFSITVIDDKDLGLCLTTIPLLLENYLPCMDKLPLFLLRLVVEVNWAEERLCLDGIANEISLFYAIEPTIPECVEAPQLLTSNIADEQDWAKEYKRSVEHVLFPAFRSEWFVVPDASLSDPSDLAELASLPELYKVFERC